MNQAETKHIAREEEQRSRQLRADKAWAEDQALHECYKSLALAEVLETLLKQLDPDAKAAHLAEILRVQLDSNRERVKEAFRLESPEVKATRPQAGKHGCSLSEGEFEHVYWLLNTSLRGLPKGCGSEAGLREAMDLLQARQIEGS